MTRISVQASELWNPTGVIARRGATYRLEVPPAAQWKDWMITCGPNGFRNWLDPFGWLLRVAKAGGQRARYFTLIGTIGRDESRAFVIGSGCTFSANWDGEIFCFANDARFAYRNNRGAISVTITESSPPTP